MFDWFLFGPMILGLSFWPAVFLWVLIAAIFVELCFDNGTAAAVTLTAAMIAAYLLGFWTLDFVVAHQRALLWLLAFYVPAGILWATAKWWLYCNSLATKVRKYLDEAASSIRRRPNMNDAIFDKEMRDLRSRLYLAFEPLPPAVSGHKSDLIRWMAWWPLSIIASMFDDLLRRIFTAIYDAFTEMWQAISTHSFRNVRYQNPPTE